MRPSLPVRQQGTIASARPHALILPGVAGSYASTPDSAAVSIAYDLDIRVKIALANWASSTLENFVGKYAAGNQRSYQFGTDQGAAAGKLRFGASQTVSGAAVASSSVVIGFTNGTVHWVRMTWVNSTNVVKFYTSDDGVAWTQLGTDATLSLSGIFNSTAPLELGSYDGSGSPAAGGLYHAQLRNNVLDDGTGIVFDANLDKIPIGAASFVESSSNPATVTINGTAKFGYG